MNELFEGQVSPIFDLASLTLEVTNLEKVQTFYGQLLGLTPVSNDPECGTLELRVGEFQTLRFWKPLSRRCNSERLSKLGARGGSHVHYALQIPHGGRQNAQNLLTFYGVEWQEIDLADPDDPQAEPDLGTYFFDPFGHGLELREIMLEPADPRFPAVPPVVPGQDARSIPVLGLREAALAFEDFESMLERLPQAYGFAFAEQMEDRAFGQFTLGPQVEKDGQGTPRRWLYCWDPQVGLADMLGGEHATVSFYADIKGVRRRLERLRDQGQGLELLEDEHGLAVRDPSGHVFEFLPLPLELSAPYPSSSASHRNLQRISFSVP